MKSFFTAKEVKKEVKKDSPKKSAKKRKVRLGEERKTAGSK